MKYQVRISLIAVMLSLNVGCALDAAISKDLALLDPEGLTKSLPANSVITLKTLATPFEAEPSPSLVFKNVEASTLIAVFSDDQCKTPVASSLTHLESQGSDWVELKMPTQTVNSTYNYYALFPAGCKKVAEHTYKQVVAAHIGSGSQGLIFSDRSMVMYGQTGWGAQASHLSTQLQDIVKTAHTNNSTAVVHADGTTYLWGKDNNNEFFDDSTPLPYLVEDIHANLQQYYLLGKDQKIYEIRLRSDAVTPQEPLDPTPSYKALFGYNNQICGLTTANAVSCSSSDPAPGDNNNIKSVTFNRGFSHAIAAIKTDGTVIAWGDAGNGGDMSGVVPAPSGITEILGTEGAFAAYSATDKRVYVWGNAATGGDPDIHSASLTSDVKKIVGTEGAFAALKEDGSLLLWGVPSQGQNPGAVAGELYDIVDVYATERHMVALRDDGKAFYWGNFATPSTHDDVITVYTAKDNFVFKHGDGTFSTPDNALPEFHERLPSPAINVLSSSSYGTFIGVNSLGQIVTAGDESWGNDYSEDIVIKPEETKRIVSGYQTTVTLKKDGTVSCNGDPNQGGDCSALSSQLQSVVDIVANGDGYTEGAVAALKADGTVVLWGHTSFGGDAASIQAQLTDIKKIDAQVGRFIFVKNDDSVLMWNGTATDTVSPISTYAVNSGAITFLKKDKTAVSFGDASTGGDSAALAASLVSVKQVAASTSAFAALKEDGTVVCWGNTTDDGGDCSGLSLTNIKELHSTNRQWAGAFAALSNDGKVTSWGNQWFGGDAGDAETALETGVSKVYANGSAFLAVKGNQVLIWGDINAGATWEDSEGWITSIKEVHTIKRGFLVVTNDNDGIVFGSNRIEPRRIEGVEKVYSTDSAFYVLTKISVGDELHDHLTSYGEFARLLPQKIHYMLKGSTLEVQDDRLLIRYPDGSGRKF